LPLLLSALLSRHDREPDDVDGASNRHGRWRHDVMDPTIDEMLIVYAAALRRHQQHLEDGCDRRGWQCSPGYLIDRAVWSANSTEEAVRDGRPRPWNPSVFNQNDQ
jgi:hypothetical protein